MAKLQDVLTSLDLQQLTVVLCDFNYDLLSPPEHTITQLMGNCGFGQYVTGPTTDDGSLLDHVCANKDMEIVMDIVDTYYLDHDAVYVSINLSAFIM